MKIGWRIALVDREQDQPVWQLDGLSEELAKRLYDNADLTDGRFWMGLWEGEQLWARSDFDCPGCETCCG